MDSPSGIKRRASEMNIKDYVLTGNLSGSQNGKSLSSLVEPLEIAGVQILKSTGEDINREGLLRTPERFSKAMQFLTSGYEKTVEEVVGQGVFDAEGSGLVTVKDIEFYSMCEHHLLPFWGSVNVSYYPHRKILGLSKIPRLIELYARRFQVQERITKQIAESIFDVLRPKAVFVKVEAAHLCMMMRGVEKQNSKTQTEYQIGIEVLSELEKTRILNI